MTYEEYVRQAWRQVAQRARDLGISVPDEGELGFEERVDDGGKRRRLAAAHVKMLEKVEEISSNEPTNN